MKNHFKRGLALLLTLVTVMSLFSGTVSAMDLSKAYEVSWDYVLTDEDGNSFTWYGGISASSNDFGHSYADRAHTMHDYTVKRNGLTGSKSDWTYDTDYVYAFCIEPGVPLPNSTEYTGSDSATHGDKWERLSPSQKDLIMLALSYGYPNRRDLQTSKDANACYSATQLIVWQIALGWRTSPTNVNDRSYPMDGHSGTMTEQLTRNGYFKNFYDKILDDMAKHSVRPSFMSVSSASAPVYEMTQSGGQWVLTLTDTNNVLSDYYVQSSGGVTATISGNTLTLRSSTAITSEIQVSLERRMPSTNMTTGFLVWSVPGKEGANQDMVTGVSNDPLRGYLKLKVSTGNLSILKTTQHNNGSVSGFTFEVRNSSNALIGTYTTNSSGKIDIPNLVAGTYSVKEINLSSDFVTPTPNPKSVTVSAGQTASISFDNVKKRGVITVSKTDANPIMGGYSLAGAVFEVRDAGGTLVDTITTGSDGKAQTKILPLGVYRIKETKAPYGFVLDTNTYTSTISGTQGTAAVVYSPDVTVAEQPQVGRINIEKYNSTPNMGDYELTPAVFEIRNNSGVLIDTITTDAQGKAQSKDLKLGDYIVSEKSAPYGYVRNTNTFNVSLEYGNQTETCVYKTVSVPERPQTGIIRVHKLNATPDMGDYPLNGAVFEVRAAQDIKKMDGTFIYHKGDLADTITTNSSGEAQTKELPLGAYTVREKTAPYGFVLNTEEYNPVLSYKGQEVSVSYTDVTIPEQPQVGTITITKLDKVTGTRAQGDSTLNGAVFEVYAAADIKKLDGSFIYKKDQLVDTLYCGSNNYATSKELPLGDYYYKEKVPPVGYTLDPNSYPVTIEYQGQNVSVVKKYVDLKNKVIEGQIALVKHTDDPDPDVDPSNPQVEAPLEGAIFEVYLKSAGSYDNAMPTERDLITTDENGYAKTGLLPYGIYTVRETYAPGDVKLVEPFDVFISKDGNVYRYILSDPWFRSLVKIVKVDSETGKTIPAAGVSFKVKDLSTGQWVVQHINYPTPIDIDVFETAPDGTLVMPESLKSGDYELYEQEAPYGYVLSKDPLKFTIHSTQVDPAIAEVYMANNPAKGIIKVEKTGNMLTGVAVTDTSFGKQHTPIFSLTGLPGAVFNVIAAEDIYTGDGTLRAAKGTVVDTITTDANGYAETKQLYLGNYEVVEVKAPVGFVLDKTSHSVSLVYEGQEVPVVSSQIGIGNTRQTVEIELQKLMEKPVDAPEGFNAYQDVMFGLFADEDINAVDGSVIIAKGSLVALIQIDDTGKGVVSGELPFAKYYVQEIGTNIYYQLNSMKYPVVAEYQGQDVTTSKVQVNNGGIALPNETKLAQLTITKTGEMLVGAARSDNKDYELYTPIFETRNLPGATFDIVADEDIFDVYGRLIVAKGTVVDTVTTKSDGTATSKLLHLGRYIIVETNAPYGTVLDSTPFPVILGFDGEVTDIISHSHSVHNERQKAEINLEKSCEWPEGADEDYNPYNGVIFGLYAAEDVVTADGEAVIPAGSLMEFITFDKNGLAEIKTDLPFGSFYVQEFMTTLGYAYDDTKYDVIFNYAGQETAKVKIDVNGGEPVVNKLQRGSLKIIKTFEGSETPIEGVPFTIVGKTVVGTTVTIEAFTNENGEILLEDLLIGDYTVTELDADLTIGYILSEPQTLSIVPDKIAEMTIENKLQRGDLKIIKTFEGKDTSIAGVKFTVTGTSITGIPFEGEFFTDENGEILIEALPVGDYTVKEIASDLTIGYVLSDEQTSSVAADELTEMRIDNKLIRGDIRIIKTDASTGKPLEGAKFGLYDLDGNLIAEVTTDADGIAEFLNIPYGEYEIKEISAPEGYMLNNKVFKAFIKENGETINIEIDNKLIPPPGDNPKTGDNSNVLLWVALIGISAATLIGLGISRKRKRNNEVKEND